MNVSFWIAGDFLFKPQEFKNIMWNKISQIQENVPCGGICIKF